MLLNPPAVLAILLALGCIFLPGAAWLACFPMRGRNLAEQAAAAFGLGVAVIALIALATFLTGLAVSAGGIIAFFSICASAAVIGLWKNNKKYFRNPGTAIAATLLLVAILALRFYQARGLEFPAWVDSIHHTFLVRMLLERARLPADLSPWLPVPLYYHFGFHSAAALFSAVSGLPPDRAILLFGQLLNAMASLSIFRLSMALRREARIALLAMAVSGFLTQMPAYYLSWGRYTLLTGMVLLPLAMAEMAEFLYRAPRWSTAIRAAVFTAGTLLAHYLAGVMLILFCAALGILALRDAKHRIRLRWLAAAVGGGALLALPWLAWMLANALPGIAFRISLPPVEEGIAGLGASWDYFIRMVQPTRNIIVLMLGAAGILISFRMKVFRAFAFWAAALALLSLPWGIRLAPFRYDHYLIVLFLPASVLAAMVSVRLIETIHRRIPKLFVWPIAAALVGICLCAGAVDSRNVMNPATILAEADDRFALDWVKTNTPADALFLINVTHWQAGLYRGTDGGWWLLPYSNRETLLPPVFYSNGSKAYSGGIHDLAVEVLSFSECSTEFLQFLARERISHLYLRDGVGSIKAEWVDGCGSMVEVYRRGSIGIFKVLSTDQGLR